MGKVAPFNRLHKSRALSSHQQIASALGSEILNGQYPPGANLPNEHDLLARFQISRTVLREVTIGDFSYFERHAEAIYTEIGKFCSIAANTRINALEHPLGRATTHKVSYRPNEYFRYLGVDQPFRERRRQKQVRIGHDVWIGHGAVILPGIHIGNGAVVGANSVVTRDVPTYAIVVGAPAKTIRSRFSDDVAARLAVDVLALVDGVT